MECFEERIAPALFDCGDAATGGWTLTLTLTLTLTRTRTRTRTLTLALPLALTR